MKRFITFLSVLFFAVLAFAQTPAEQQLLTVNKEYKAQILAKDYDGAIGSINRMLEIAATGNVRVDRGQMFYARACLQALAGRKESAIADARAAVRQGFTDYSTFATDTDLDSLRPDPDFKSFMAELRSKYGPQPLAWDRSQPAPAFPMTFDDPQEPKFLALRKEFVIDPVVSGGKDDLQRLVALATWTSAQWKHSPTQMANATDPIGVLREARAGGRFICTDYAIVLAGVARAYNMKARVLNLLPRDVESRSEAHTLTEVWLPRLEKWALADGQYGIVPEKNGVPLSAVELQAALANDEPVQCAGNADRCNEWKPFVLRNLYYFKISNDQRSFGKNPTSQLVLVPKGAPEPHKFNGGNPEIFKGSIYTSNPDSFYAPPK
jgi:hypothetical protein